MIAYALSTLLGAAIICGVPLLLLLAFRLGASALARRPSAAEPSCPMCSGVRQRWLQPQRRYW